MRFRKSIKLAPGIRMNVSGSGIGWTLGGRGASVGIGKRGTYLNTSIPGTGLSSRTKLSGGRPTSTGKRDPADKMTVTVVVDDEGTISFKDNAGNPLSQAMVDLARKQQGDRIKGLIQQQVDQINSQIEALAEMHLYTPRPVKHIFKPGRFSKSEPAMSTLKQPGFFCKFFKSCVARVEADNLKSQHAYSEKLKSWNTEKDAFDDHQKADAAFLDRLNLGDVSAIETYFEAVLQDIAWPRETIVDYDLESDGAMYLNIDLPEIEDMPTKTASSPARGLKLNIKEMSPTAIQKLYMQHVHAIGFRILGEAFAASPAIRKVSVSSYSQRASKVNGQINDEYLYSVQVNRSQWEMIRFENLTEIDVVESLAAFDLRRDMTKTGIFKPIVPFGMELRQ